MTDSPQRHLSFLLLASLSLSISGQWLGSKYTHSQCRFHPASNHPVIPPTVFFVAYSVLYSCFICCHLLFLTDDFSLLSYFFLFVLTIIGWISCIFYWFSYFCFLFPYVLLDFSFFVCFLLSKFPLLKISIILRFSSSDWFVFVYFRGTKLSKYMINYHSGSPTTRENKNVPNFVPLFGWSLTLIDCELLCPYKWQNKTRKNSNDMMRKSVSSSSVNIRWRHDCATGWSWLCFGKLCQLYPMPSVFPWIIRG